MLQICSHISNISILIFICANSCYQWSADKMKNVQLLIHILKCVYVNILSFSSSFFLCFPTYQQYYWWFSELSKQVKKKCNIKMDCMIRQSIIIYSLASLGCQDYFTRSISLLITSVILNKCAEFEKCKIIINRNDWKSFSPSCSCTMHAYHLIFSVYIVNYWTFMSFYAAYSKCRCWGLYTPLSAMQWVTSQSMQSRDVQKLVLVFVLFNAYSPLGCSRGMDTLVDSGGPNTF